MCVFGGEQGGGEGGDVREGEGGGGDVVLVLYRS